MLSVENMPTTERRARSASLNVDEALAESSSGQRSAQSESGRPGRYSVHQLFGSNAEKGPDWRKLFYHNVELYRQVQNDQASGEDKRNRFSLSPRQHLRAEQASITEICRKKLADFSARQHRVTHPRRTHRMRLSPVERNKAWRYIYSPTPAKVLISKYNTQITGTLLNSLAPMEWVNDEIMNFYILILQQRNDRHLLERQPVPKTFFWSTFFYTKLTDEDRRPSTGYNYDNVRRWTKRKNVDLFTYDLILIPIHMRKIHWALGVVDLRNHAIRYLDSMNGKYGPKFAAIMRRYIEDEHRDKKGEAYPNMDLLHYEETANVPQQTNGSDCGVFVCQFCECLSDGRQLDFEQKDIPDRRLKMAVQIVAGEAS